MGVILKPVITEKMTDKGEKLNQFGFIVDNSANKLQIKEEVEELYGVQVLSVNTMNYSGKRKSRFTKSGVISGKTKGVIIAAQLETDCSRFSPVNTKAPKMKICGSM